MKKSMMTFALVMMTAPFASATGIATCELYQAPNPSQTIPLVSKGQKQSATMQVAMGDSGAIGASFSENYRLGNITVELAESQGCSMDCWSTRHILVTADGVAVYTEGDTKNLTSSNELAFYPSISFIKNGQKLTIQCIADARK